MRQHYFHFHTREPVSASLVHFTGYVRQLFPAMIQYAFSPFTAYNKIKSNWLVSRGVSVSCITTSPLVIVNVLATGAEISLFL